MRHPNALVVAVVLSVFLPCPAWTCPWVPPTDPCAQKADFESEFLGDLPRAVAVELEEEEEEEGEAEDESVEVVTTEEVEPDCHEVRRRIEERDLDRRLTTLEDLIDATLGLEDCPEGVDALRRTLLEEEDAFLVYRAVQALAEQLEDPMEILDLLEHDSADVRRKVAELLELEIFDPARAARVAAALRREEDPWTRLAMAAMEPEGHDDAVTAAYAALMRDEGPAAAAALLAMASREDSLAPILAALEREGTLRSAAILMLQGRGHDDAAREALLGLLKDGSMEERVWAASGLVNHETAVASREWQGFVLDPQLPARVRAVLLLEASYAEPWRAVACQAKQADGALSAAVDRLLADARNLPGAMVLPGLSPVQFARSDVGTIRPEGQTSVRCASRPFGPPRAGAARIRAGATFYANEWFTAKGIAWLAGAVDPACWIPANVLDREDLPAAPSQEDVLETDLPVEALADLRAALAAGDLEPFDPMPGYTGIRLRGATPEMRAKWEEGEKGRREILAIVEAKATRRLAER